MTCMGMPQTIGGKVYVETEDGYEELGEVSDVELTTESFSKFPESFGDLEWSFTVDLSNNRRKMRKRPKRRGAVNKNFKHFMRGRFV